MKLPLPPLIATVLGLALPSGALAAEFAVEKADDGIVIKIDGKLFTKYVTGDTVGNKPYFYPVIGPTGKGMTRAYPMEDVKGEAQDHPHHRSFYFGHQFINDFDTWHEELTLKERAKGDATKLAELKKKLGATRHRETVQAESTGDRARLVATSDYVDATGKLMATDRRTFTFHVAADGSRVVDSEIVFTGVSDDGVTFSDAKDAGFSLRVAHSMSVKAGEGGRIVNSLGDRDADAWGKRAPWCDFNGPVGGEHLGIAVLNHPSSFRHPTPWHARDYGLFTANPFGLKSVAGEKEDGAVTLKKGETFTLRHRVIFHRGDEKAAKIAEAYEAYASEKP